MDNNIVIFVFGLAVTMTTLFSTIIYIIGSDHPDEPNKKA